MGHGGGALSAEPVEHLFVPAYGSETPAGLRDPAEVSPGGARPAFSTGSCVVRPLFFPGGTVDDLAMSGAKAAYLSCAVIIEGRAPDCRWSGGWRGRSAPPPRRRTSRSSPATPRWSTRVTAAVSPSTPPASE